MAPKGNSKLGHNMLKKGRKYHVTNNALQKKGIKPRTCKKILSYI